MESNKLNQKDIWKSFCEKYNVSYHFVLLATKSYEENIKKYGVTSKSSERIKSMASDLPVILVEIGKDENSLTFYGRFAMGNDVKSWWYKDRTDGIEFECHCSTPDDAYEKCLEEAEKYNRNNYVEY